MDYQRIYEELIAKAACCDKAGYVEVHHIRPKCIGGDDSKHNLVALHPREHFLAHWLLAKIHPDNKSLTYAWNMMCVGRTVSSHLYKYAREKVSQAKTGMTWGNHTEETKIAMSLHRKGRKQGPRSEESKENMRNAKLGTTQSEETVSKRAVKNRKPVISIKDGVETLYASVKDAGLALYADPSNISKVCKGVRSTYKGYSWRYAD